PNGKIFDDKLISLLKTKSWKQILDLDQGLINDAGECGLRSILILLGIIKNLNYKPELLSYEGPFGVGYLVMNFKL
ncbi:MAG: extradiol ring-cleavage dioxygenase, partial [Patescibacteria group bacterium]|nr:extradiol ring-cleavage dioxygenase [Patescibacteria group bacterium]